VFILDDEGAQGLVVLQDSIRSGAECTPHYRIRLEQKAASAAGNDQGWLIATQSDSGHAALLLLDDDGQVRWTIPGDDVAGSSVNAGFGFLSASRGSFVLSSMRFPFAAVRIDQAGLRVGVLEGRSAATTRDWIGLRVVQLRGGFLQTIADPASDRRILLSFGLSGELMSRKEIDVAMGFLAASPNGNLAVALRRTDFDEIVTYRERGSAPQ
jgi:hypothetical protein